MNLISVLACLMTVYMMVTMATPLEKRQYAGDGTFYNVGLGSCGKNHGNDQYVAALNAPQMKNPGNPNHNKLCDRRIRVTGPKGSVTVKIVSGSCPSSQYKTPLTSLSPSG